MARAQCVLPGDAHLVLSLSVVVISSKPFQRTVYNLIASNFDNFLFSQFIFARVNMMFRSSTDEVSTSGAEASESAQTSETGRRSGNALSFMGSGNFSEEPVSSSSSHQRVEDETTSSSHDPLLPRTTSSGDVVASSNLC